jgi:carbamate kinase
MSTRQTPIVVALGGNAISPAHAEGNIPEQFQTTRTTVRRLADVIAAGHNLVITHGNGPQVGNVLRRVELAAHEVYPLPLDICVADTQAGMGYMIEQCLLNELRRRGVQRSVSTLVTAVEVDANDPEFNQPTKPIGQHYDQQRAHELQQRYGWQIVEVPGGDFRRVVPSPQPRRIVEIDLIRRLARDGDLLIAAGGGGIPVTRNTDGDYVGVEAVIDKDRTSALLAREIDASLFVIATDVERVALNYGKPDECGVALMTVSQARQHLADGQFPPGSMGPKVEAAIDFVQRAKASDSWAVVCDLRNLADALAGRSGTQIVRG